LVRKRFGKSMPPMNGHAELRSTYTGTFIKNYIKKMGHLVQDFLTFLDVMRVK
jgi:hypothetical protein